MASSRPRAGAGSRKPVIVVSVGGQVLSRITVIRAATMIATSVATPVLESPRIAVLRSPSVTADVHEMLMIARSAWRPWNRRTADSYASNWAILARDEHLCAYCGRHGAQTVDHILPRSRGGRSTFGNLVACCRGCNSAKADRTPAEAGMELLWAPYVHDPWATDQAYVREMFELALSDD